MGTEYIIMREDDVLGVLDGASQSTQEGRLIQIDNKETIHGKTDYL